MALALGALGSCARPSDPVGPADRVAAARNPSGRYQMARVEANGVFVLDTRYGDVTMCYEEPGTLTVRCGVPEAAHR